MAAEVIDTIVPRQMARVRAHPPRAARRLEATDIEASWTYGPGTTVAMLSAPAEQLLLLPWGRTPSSSEAFRLDRRPAYWSRAAVRGADRPAGRCGR